MSGADPADCRSCGDWSDRSAYQGITCTTHQKVVDIAPIRATKEERRTIPLPPILGAIALVGGVAVLATRHRSA